MMIIPISVFISTKIVTKFFITLLLGYVFCYISEISSDLPNTDEFDNIYKLNHKIDILTKDIFGKILFAKDRIMKLESVLDQVLEKLMNNIKNNKVMPCYENKITFQTRMKFRKKFLVLLLPVVKYFVSMTKDKTEIQY